VRYLLLELAEEVVQLGLGGRRELLQPDPLARYRRGHNRPSLCPPETRWHTQRNQDRQTNSATAHSSGGGGWRRLPGDAEAGEAGRGS
jgi:hypothetical protein